jgi:hypothetical protein
MAEPGSAVRADHNQNENCKLQKSNWPKDAGDRAAQIAILILQFAMKA